MFQAIAIDPAGEARAVDLATAEGRAQAAEADHLWVWSKRLAATRIEDLTELQSPARRQDRRLTVAVRWPRVVATARVEVISAPEQMWAEVPESLLPRSSLAIERTDRGRLQLPVAADQRWRLRAVGRGFGSSWLTPPAGSSRVELDLLPAVDLGVKIVGDDGPLAYGRASVIGLQTGRQRAALSAVEALEEHGQVRLKALPGDLPIALVVTADGYMPRSVEGVPADLPAEIRLPRGLRLTGRLVDATGRAVVGASVTAEAWLPGSAPVLQRQAAESDRAGQWSILAMPRTDAVMLTVEAAGHPPLRQRVDLSAGDIDLGDLVLEPGYRASLRVVDEDGVPVASASLSVGGTAVGTTGDDGQLAVESIAVNRWLELTVEAAGFVPAQRREIFRPAEPPEPRTIALSRAFMVTGQFLAGSGAPVEGGQARVRAGSDEKSYPLEMDGRFSLQLAPEKDYELKLSAPSVRTLAVRLAKGEPGETRDLGQLTGAVGYSVSGWILDRETGAVVRRARIWSPRSGAGGSLVSWVQEDIAAAVSQEDGFFDLTGLDAFPITVHVEAAGYAAASILVPGLEEGTSAELGEVALSRGSRVEVRVAGAADRSVVAQLAPSGGWRALDLLRVPVQFGRAVFHHVPSGSAHVVVMEELEILCSGTVDVEDGADSVFDCGPDDGLVVSGQVLVGGQAPGLGALHWFPRSAAQEPSVILSQATTSGLRRSRVFGGGLGQVAARVSEDGQFLTDTLFPGSWEVVWEGAEGSLSPPRSVVLSDEPVQELVLEFVATSIRGTVVDAAGAPVEAAKVWDSVSSAFTFTRPDGSFRLVGIEGPQARVRARFEGKTSELAQVDWSATSAREPILLTLTDHRGSELTVHLTLPDQAPAQGALVFVQGSDGYSRVLTADAQGSASTALEEPAPDQVRVAAFHGGRWATTGWKALPDGDLQEPLQLEFGPVGALALHNTQSKTSISVLNPQGWRLDLLLAQLGAPLTPGSESVDLAGLPVGQYTVESGRFRTAVSIREGQRTDLDVGGPEGR
jgi:hypothetical protein